MFFRELDRSGVVVAGGGGGGCGGGGVVDCFQQFIEDLLVDTAQVGNEFETLFVAYCSAVWRGWVGGKWVGGWGVNGRMSGWVGKWVDGWVDGWVSGWVGG